MSFALKMLEMLTSAYNRTDIVRLQKGELPETNIGKLFCLAGWGFDILLEQTERVRLWDDIDQMRGRVLERFGRDFGVERGEASDEIFRIMIKVKIISMLAGGNLDTLILAAANLFGVTPEDVRHEEVYPAKVYLYIDEDRLDEEHKNISDVIAGLMSRVKAAGVGLRIFYRTYHEYNQMLFLGTLTVKTVRICAKPYLTENIVTKTASVNIGVPTLIQIRQHFGPDSKSGGTV